MISLPKLSRPKQILLDFCLVFLFTAVLFGFEHDRIVAGIVAGAAYGALLCWRRNLFLCVAAHGLTNFLLGLWVVWKGAWSFW